MKTLILICVLCFSTTAQDIKTEYDKFKDITSISFEGGYVLPPKTNQAPNVKMRTMFVFDGPKMRTKVPLFLMSFTAVCYRSCPFEDAGLIFLADGEKVELSRVRSDLNTGHRPFTESLRFSITREDFEKIASAKKVELQIGWYEAEFNSKQLQGLAELWARSNQIEALSPSAIIQR